MTFVKPPADQDVSEKVAQTYSRIREVLETEQIPEVFRCMAVVPPLLNDFFMNFRKFVLSDGKLNQKQKLLIAAAVAGQSGSLKWLEYLMTLAPARSVSQAEITEVLAVGATNSMYNVLFKFRAISGTEIFHGMGVGLRAHTFQNTSLGEPLVELINLALSTVNGCQPCTTAHVARARGLGLSDEAIHEAVQCAATMICGTQFLRSVGACTEAP